MKELFSTINMLDDITTMELLGIESEVKRLLVILSMIIGVLLKIERQKVAKLLFYIFFLFLHKKVRFIYWWLT